MRWTEETPTEYGYYWIKYRTKSNGLVMEVVMFQKMGDIPIVLYIGTAHFDKITQFLPKHKILWYGPIDYPEG